MNGHHYQTDSVDRCYCPDDDIEADDVEGHYCTANEVDGFSCTANVVDGHH